MRAIRRKRLLRREEFRRTRRRLVRKCFSYRGIKFTAEQKKIS